MAETTKKSKDKTKPAKIDAKIVASSEPVADAPNAPIEAVPEPVGDSDSLLEDFTSVQIAALARVKQAVARGEYSDLTPEFKKLLFVKWLVEHDKIGS